jgi:hypothetical protein
MKKSQVHDLTLKVRGCGALAIEETSHAGSAVPLDRQVRALCHSDGIAKHKAQQENKELLEQEYSETEAQENQNTVTRQKRLKPKAKITHR